MDPRTHLKLAATAFVVACALWIGVHNEDRITVPLTVPIVYVHPSDVVRLSGAEEVSVRVRTSRGRAKTVTKTDVTLKVDNREGLTGRRMEVLSARSANASFGVEVVSIEPERFMVEYDRISSRHVPVRVRIAGEPEADHRVENEGVRAEPPRLLMEGPSTILGSVEAVHTQPVSVAGQRAPVRSKDLLVEPPHPLLQFKGPRTVAALVPIVPRLGNVVFEDVPIAVVRGPWDTSAPNPPRLQATLDGPLPSLRLLPVSAILLSADVSEKQPNREDYRVDVLRGVDQALCPGCTVSRLAPQEWVNVNVRRTRREETPASGPSESSEESGTEPVPAAVVDAVPTGRAG